MIKKLFNKLFPPRKLTIEQIIEANYQAGYLKYTWS